MDLLPWHNWISGGLLLCSALILGAALHRIVFYFISLQSPRETVKTWSGAVLTGIRRPAFYLILLLALDPLIRALPLDERQASWIQHAVLLLVIATLSWILIAALYEASEVFISRVVVDSDDQNVQGRRVRTQLVLIRRITSGLIIILTIAMMLTTFPDIWNLGAGLFASAGVAGIILGTASKGVLGNLLAGLQIALTEPIRIGDVVIMNGERGRIEEIGAAYVTVCLWDLRRIVVPLNYFIEEPFENWTRHPTHLLGTVFLYVDYTVPVEEIRGELTKMIQECPLWDQNVCTLQVTSTTKEAIEIRALISARDSASLFDLRCIIREKLVAYMQKTFPDALPRIRLYLEGSNSEKELFNVIKRDGHSKISRSDS